MDRREFLKRSAVVGGYCVATKSAIAQAKKVAIVVPDDGHVASSKPGTWAAGELERALTERGVSVDRQRQLPRGSSADFTIVAGTASALASVLPQGKGTLPSAPESFALLPGGANHPRTIFACGLDERGLVYALTELADRVRYASAPMEVLGLRATEFAAPANPIRAISRIFASELEDKSWYYDRAFWDAYFSMLASNRFNRFGLTFGLAYDFTRDVTDSYFHFAYPFLVSVPGYDVRATGLSDEERARNLDTLRYISEAAEERGIFFQLGLWTHAFQWTDSPHANYVITGLMPETQAQYCHDALKTLLVACPSIGGVVIRIHGESGVADGSYDFWKTVFDGAKQSGRRVELNLHAKGIDQRMIDNALATGLPVTVSPKYWAEHQGLAYQQSSIRELEKPRNDVSGFFAISFGSRNFMRYSYGDLLTAGRRYGVYTRMFPGTQRVLLWGDPAATSAYGRSSQFCGEMGADLFEPLSFKGRRGSGVPGGRCSYADASLNPRYDFEKFAYYYRLWGRHLYAPDADPESWRRFLRSQFGAAAPSVETALANASRILPLVTTAHAPSAANNNYWPEMYTNMPIVTPDRRSPYSDTPTPRVFGKASAFDPELFSTVDDCAAELLGGPRSGRYSAVDVASWLEELAATADASLAQADSAVRNRNSVDFRRLAIDIRMQTSLGRFFAAKLRAGVLYAIFTTSGDSDALDRALAQYRQARDAWAKVVAIAQGVYLPDVSYGPEKNLRGNWADRLPAIDGDIAEMEKKRSDAAQPNPGVPRERVSNAIKSALAKPAPPHFRWSHTAPANFAPGAPLHLELKIDHPPLSAITIHYRHVDQAESYAVDTAQSSKGNCAFTIPAQYTSSPFDLQYFFTWNDANGDAGLLPGLDLEKPQQPYYVVFRR